MDFLIEASDVKLSDYRIATCDTKLEKSLKEYFPEEYFSDIEEVLCRILKEIKEIKELKMPIKSVLTEE
jgi:hypothetical protein